MITKVGDYWCHRPSFLVILNQEARVMMGEFWWVSVGGTSGTASRVAAIGETSLSCQNPSLNTCVHVSDLNFGTAEVALTSSAKMAPLDS
jgi:hypothetical protein